MELDITEVYENLYIGAYPQDITLKEFSKGFELVVVCVKVPGGSFPGTLVIPLQDNNKPIPEAAIEGAQAIARALHTGLRVLVLCVKGKNRSALVAALALSYYLGVNGRLAAAIVCEKRGVGTLMNPSFALFLDSFSPE